MVLVERRECDWGEWKGGREAECRMAWCVAVGGDGNAHLRVFAHIRNRSNGDTKVTDGTPEICAQAVSLQFFQSGLIISIII